MHGSGNVVVESREVAGFHEIALKGSGTCLVTQGDAESLAVEAEDNLLPAIRTEVRDGRLTLDYERGPFGSIRPTRPIRFHVTVKALTALHLGGSGAIEMGSLATDRLEVSVGGSGDVTLGRLTAERLAVTIAGSGDVTIAGRVQRQEVGIAGSGDYLADRLESGEAQVSVSGSGRARLHVTATLGVRIAGSGSVEYAGDPRVSQTRLGSGTVRRLGA